MGSWGAGLALAAAGVLVARVVAPAAEHTALVRLAGDGLALLGLVVIALGIGRRYRGRPPLD